MRSLRLMAAVALIAGAQGGMVSVVHASADHVTHRIPLDPSRVHLEPGPSMEGEVRVEYPGAIPAPEGTPDLPQLLQWIEIPAGMRAVAVKATPEGLREIGSAKLAAAAAEHKNDGTETTARTGTPAPAAGDWAVLSAQGNLRGHWIAGVLVSPVIWEQASGRLLAASAVTLELELAPAGAVTAEDVLPRQRVVREIEAKFDAGAGRMIAGYTPLAPTEELGGGGDDPAGPGPYQPTFRPSTDGSAVEYVIVTSEALKTEFEDLADWKTRKGVQATVRTVEWIDQTYPNGADRAERIRFFIRDAYQNWGTLFVLLGGDTDIIPPRYAITTLEGGEAIPADYYYACLHRNWNLDGDARFGEGLTGSPSDSCDFFFEVTVGRAPVSTLAQAATFVDKLFLYEQSAPQQVRYPASILVLAERLFAGTHGADIAEQALAMVPAWMRKARLYEESASYPGSIELTRQTAIDSINAGFGIVHHVGHGFRNTMSVGSGTINNADSDNLINGPRNSVVFAINCSSASIDFNSIGERWVKNPNGGSISYLGTSRLAYVTPSVAFQNEWYATVWQDSIRSLGLATDLSRSILIPSSLADGTYRWNLTATTLLGDPEVDVYTNALISMQVSHPGSVALGAAPITVTVSAQGTPVPGATVTLWKENEVYVRGTTGGAGTVQLPITANTTGPVTITAHKTYYRPYVSAVNVTSTAGAYLFVNAQTVDDDGLGMSSGDADGAADAGETIELRLTLRNGGGTAATNVQATLLETDPDNCIAINAGTVSYGTINAGGQSQGSGAFLITIANSALVACQPVLTLNITSGQGNWQDQLVLPIRRPYLDHYSHFVDDVVGGDGDEVIEAGETINYRVTLKNTGQDRATTVTGTLAALQKSNQLPHPLVTMVDGTSSFGTINPNGSVQGDKFEFTLAPNCDPGTVLLRLTLTDHLGPVQVQLLDVVPPVSAENMTSFGSTNWIRLEWAQLLGTDTKGFDVWRASGPGGPFSRINEHTVDGSSVYEDRDLQPLTRYYYQIVTRDSSYNASSPSTIFSGTTNPPFTAGWPIELGQQTSSSAIVVDIDGGNHTEILCGGEMTYAWHGDGTEVVDGDGDDRTNGPFSLHGRSTGTSGFAATPAAGNLDLQGMLEVANVGFTAESVFVWNTAGQIMPGWPKTVFEQLNWGSVLLADLDASGDLEVVVWAAGGGRLFAWHHNGVELVDGDQNPATNGVLARVFGVSFNYGSPAVANMDGDPALEIVVPVNRSADNSGAVYAFNIDGSPCSGWPFFTGPTSEVSSSPAVVDLDGDGDDEIIVSCERAGGRVYVLNGNGSVVLPWPRNVPCVTADARLPSPVIADVNGNGSLDIVMPDTDGRLWVWDRFGNVLPGFPMIYLQSLGSQATQSTASVGDVDGDPQLEICFGDESGKVNGVNHDGTLAAGFPIQTNGEVRSTPAIWDADRDGLNELTVVGYDQNVYVWDLTSAFNTSRLPWPFFRHDTRNTGRFSTGFQVGIEDEPPAAPVARPAFHAAMPNPFRPSTMLSFDVPGQAGGARPVTLDVYDVTGRLVRRLIEGQVGTGRRSVAWDGRGQDGRGVGAGVYFARIAIGDFTATQKLTLLR